MSQGADIYPDSLQLPWHTVQRPDASARRLPWRDRSSSSNLRSGARPASTGHDRHHNERPVSAWTRNVHRTGWMLLELRLIAFSPLECMAPDVVALTPIAFDELSNRNIASTRSQRSRYNRSQTVLVDHFEEGGAQLGPVSQVNAHGSSRSQKRNHRRSLPDPVRQHAIRHRALLARIEPELSVGVSSARRVRYSRSGARYPSPAATTSFGSPRK